MIVYSIIVLLWQKQTRIKIFGTLLVPCTTRRAICSQLLRGDFFFVSSVQAPGRAQADWLPPQPTLKDEHFDSIVPSKVPVKLLAVLLTRSYWYFTSNKLLTIQFIIACIPVLWGRGSGTGRCLYYRTCKTLRNPACTEVPYWQNGPLNR